MWFLLSFFCLVSFDNYRAAETNLTLGCEQFTVWTNAHSDPVWRFFHCPDAVRNRAQFEAIMVKVKS